MPLEGLDPQKVEPAAGGHVRQLVKLKKGIKQEDAKKIVLLVKESGLKVQAAIKGEAVWAGSTRMGAGSARAPEFGRSRSLI